jgi:hypothetical protein
MRKEFAAGVVLAVVLALGVLLRTLWRGALVLALLGASTWLLVAGVRLLRMKSRRVEGLMAFLLAAGLLGYSSVVLVEWADDGGRLEQALGMVVEVQRFSRPPTSFEQAAEGRSTKETTARISIPGYDFWHDGERLREGDRVLVTYRRGRWTGAVYVEHVQKHYPGMPVQRF